MPFKNICFVNYLAPFLHWLRYWQQLVRAPANGMLGNRLLTCCPIILKYSQSRALLCFSLLTPQPGVSVVCVAGHSIQSLSPARARSPLSPPRSPLAVRGSVYLPFPLFFSETRHKTNTEFRHIVIENFYMVSTPSYRAGYKRSAFTLMRTWFAAFNLWHGHLHKVAMLETVQSWPASRD